MLTTRHQLVYFEDFRFGQLIFRHLHACFQKPNMNTKPPFYLRSSLSISFNSHLGSADVTYIHCCSHQDGQEKDAPKAQQLRSWAARHHFTGSVHLLKISPWRGENAVKPPAFWSHTAVPRQEDR
jgi:hypothetical protein